jgi:hypothetical protein
MPISSIPPAKKLVRKNPPLTRKRPARRAGPSFAEGMRPFIGMIKNAPPDLSLREGFGDY